MNPLAVSLGLVLAAWLVALLPGADAALEFQSGSALRQPWRLLTGHLTHFGFEHLAFDSAALVLLGFLARILPARRVAGALLGAGVAIPLAMQLFAPDFHSYRGLSGLDAALFALVLVRRLQSAHAHGELRRLILLGGVALAGVAKIGFELSTQQAVFVDAAGAGFVPAPLAHAVGAVIGLLAATLPRVSLPRRAAGWTRLLATQQRSRRLCGTGRVISPAVWSRWGSVS